MVRGIETPVGPLGPGFVMGKGSEPPLAGAPTTGGSHADSTV
jgi:hypothetical protein